MYSHLSKLNYTRGTQHLYGTVQHVLYEALQLVLTLRRVSTLFFTPTAFNHEVIGHISIVDKPTLKEVK